MDCAINMAAFVPCENPAAKCPGYLVMAAGTAQTEDGRTVNHTAEFTITRYLPNTLAETASAIFAAEVRDLLDDRAAEFETLCLKVTVFRLTCETAAEFTL